MKKVVIIGAGPAGLTACFELLKEGYEVIVLEESDTVGGISKTVNYKGYLMDMGGHRFFSKVKKVNDFWQQFMKVQSKGALDDLKLNSKKNYCENGLDPEKEDNVFLIRNRVSRIYYKNKFFPYPVTLSFEVLKNLGFVTSIVSGFSYLKTFIIKKKETSLAAFYQNRFGKKLYEIFFKEYTFKVWGRYPDKIDSSWGAQRVKGVSLLKVLTDALKKIFRVKIKNVETSLIEEFYYPKYGPGQLYEEVAKECEKLGAKILLNHKVDKIKRKGNKIVSVITNGKEIKGDIFISSMPIKDLILNMDKKPSANIIDIASHLPYRSFVTVGLLVNKLKIKNNSDNKTLNDLVPDCWIYIQDKKVKLGRIQIFNNWSPYLVKDLNKVWLGLEFFCDEDDYFWNMSDKDIFTLAKNELETLNIIDESDVIDYHVCKVKKAYPAYFDSYDRIDYVIDFLKTIDNLYCVGRNGQHRYNNMDHSMMTSFEAVRLIVNDIKDKSSLFDINTEQVYHEEGKCD